MKRFGTSVWDQIHEPQETGVASRSSSLSLSPSEGRGWGEGSASFAIASLLAIFSFLAGMELAQAAQYTDKEDTSTNYVTEPMLPSGIASLQPLEGEYPYYGGAPAELLPYRNIVPHYRYWLTRLPFRGPGRDYPPPPDLKSLKVGLLSPPPYGPEAARGEMSKHGAVLAFEEANANRKSDELPFELIEKADSPQWGSAANIAVEFADNEVLAYLGTIDGDATHVALRATLKTETFMVNCSDPDPSLTETQIPWLLRVFPDNRQQGYLLSDLIVRQLGLSRIVVLRANNRPGRVGVRPFVDAVRRLGRPILQEINFKEDLRFSTQIAVVKQADPDAVVLWGNPTETGPLAAELRAAGVKAALFGFDRLVDPQFVKLAGSAAEGVTAAYFFDPNKTDPLWNQFGDRFQKRFGLKPDIYAGYSYDGAQMLIRAIKKAGPNRYRVHDVMTSFDEYQGVTGYMRFDGRWDNIAPIVLAQYKEGAWHFRPAPATSQTRAALEKH